MKAILYASPLETEQIDTPSNKNSGERGRGWIWMPKDLLNYLMLCSHRYLGINARKSRILKRG